MIDSPVQTPKPLPTLVIPPIELRPAVKVLSGGGPPAWLAEMLEWLFPIAALLFIARVRVPDGLCV